MRKFLFVLLLVVSCTGSSAAQNLKPGFDSIEFKEILQLLAQTDESKTDVKPTVSPEYQLEYTSPEFGFDNQWSLWIKNASQAVLTIRGSVGTKESWLSNAYAAMVAAQGSMSLDSLGSTSYQVASDPKAAVHAGWLLSTLYLAPDVLAQIDSCYKRGIKDFYISGHSQGGAIAYLLGALLLHKQQAGLIPAEIQFKTYTSAAPKPGNLFFAYDYEYLTQGGWSYSVVNRLDWVPEMPFSLQTTEDFNLLNPFPHLKNFIDQQGLGKKLILRHFYNQIDKPSKKALKKSEKLLGTKVFKLLQNSNSQLEEPRYFPSNNYVRTGHTIVLQPQAGYYQTFDQDTPNFFINHSYKAYLYLIDQP